ncbi:MAG: peptidoglycan DD-metalloendopeptidase family protein [Gemmatimonadetes bacterium]|nr:peptidoglycan DD-metalloendopeptidase family protein [Gemmatimonadota bacterium]
MPSVLAAQQQPTLDTTLQRSQQRLLEVRRERERLQQEMERLRGRVHSLSSELTNIERQVETTGRIVSELDLQVAAMGSQIGQTTADLIVAQDALAEKKAILAHRLSEISKRGPLYAARVLLGAESFGDLISRYKYLYLITRQDRQLVSEVEALRNRVAKQRDGLLELRNNLANRRDERAEENERYRQLEQQRQRSLRDSQREAQRMEARLSRLARDEARLNDIIAAFERRRLEAERAAGATARAGTIRTSDLGQLDWPVNGDIIYRFGRQLLPNNTTIRWNGIGIAVPMGTPVHAIAAGTVRVAEQLGTYGLSIVIDHGGGYYSVYGFLNDVEVRRGQQVQRGQVIASSGGANSDQGPHVHFEIRGQGGTALDPVSWLRRRQ